MIIRVKHIVFLLLMVLVVKHYNPLNSIAIQKYNPNQEKTNNASPIYNNSQPQNLKTGLPVTVNVGMYQPMDNSKTIEVQRYMETRGEQQRKLGNYSYSQPIQNISYNNDTQKDVAIDTAVTTATKGFCILEYLFLFDDIRDERKQRKKH